MTEREFCYWLQGIFEINDLSPGQDEKLSGAQVRVIRDHLKLVFTKVTPHHVPSSLKDVEKYCRDLNRMPAQPFPYPIVTC